MPTACKSNLGALRIIEAAPGNERNKIIDAAKILSRLFALDSFNDRTLNDVYVFRTRYPEIDAYIQT